MRCICKDPEGYGRLTRRAFCLATSCELASACAPVTSVILEKEAKVPVPVLMLSLELRGQVDVLSSLGLAKLICKGGCSGWTLAKAVKIWHFNATKQKRAQRAAAREFCAASPATSHVRSSHTSAAFGATFTTHDPDTQLSLSSSRLLHAAKRTLSAG